MGRKFNGHLYVQDGRWGAYGEGNHNQGKLNAEEHARGLRNDGYLARVTLEKQDYGKWWVCWKGPKSLYPVKGERTQFELVTNKLGSDEMPYPVFGKDRPTVIRTIKKKLRKGEKIVSLHRCPRLSR
jgi:hypothetical protein